ncbi:MAG: RNA methyltransferase [Candidatus Sericytochromatia bacterium]|nr:RNA methyltransferase [Candidatus Sericytochromatia bacterium]
MSLTPLSSVQNPRVKQARALAQRKHREAAGAFLIEGSKLLTEALTAGHVPAQVFGTQAWWARGVAVPRAERFLVPDAVLAAIATTETPDGVVAVAPLPRPVPPAPRPDPLVLVAHGLQDPGNLGTMIRAADAAGADAVIVTPGTTDPWAPKVVRGSMGSCFHLPVLPLALGQLKATFPGIRLLALTLATGASDLFEADLRGGVALLVGNEGRGLDAEALTLADAHVTIPIPGRAESLNAAMAATVCLYEAVRQRRG